MRVRKMKGVFPWVPVTSSKKAIGINELRYFSLTVSGAFNGSSKRWNPTAFHTDSRIKEDTKQFLSELWVKEHGSEYNPDAPIVTQDDIDRLKREFPDLSFDRETSPER